MAIYTVAIQSAAVAGREADYEAWYNNIHMGEVLQVAGFQSGQQFRLPEKSADGHTHVAIFRLESDDPMADLVTLGETFASGKMTPTDTLDTAVEATSQVLTPTGDAQTR